MRPPETHRRTRTRQKHSENIEMHEYNYAYDGITIAKQCYCYDNAEGTNWHTQY